MQAAPLPPDEDRRLAAVNDLDLLYTPAEERFDRITRIARQLLGTPVALLTIVGERTQWFKSAQGLNSSETPREVSFCGHTILADETFVVEDALADERFADNPLVDGPDAIPVRFYAGYPVHAADGSRVGSLCLIDHMPRRFTETDAQSLRDLAALIDTELQKNRLTETHADLLRERDVLERRTLTDDLTRGWNRRAILDLIARASATSRDVSVAMVDADEFKRINDTHGHAAGDVVLAQIAARLRGAVRESDAVGRYGGEEFCVLLDGTTPAAAQRLAERMRAAIAVTPIMAGAVPATVTVSIGIASSMTHGRDARALIAAADAALYRAKRAGRNRVEVASATVPA